jgi:hypothetical protein
MSDINQYTQEEKAFLAGSVKGIILANRDISEAELEDVDRLTEELNFDDFNQALQDFERKIKTKEDYAEAAKAITNPEFQALVLQVISDVAITDGVIGAPEEAFISNLKEIWGI